MEIPIANVYYLLCYAWDKLEERDLIKIDPTQSTELVDLFARVLSSGVDHLLKKGFDRGYVDQSEDTQRVRGRIEFQTTIRRNLLDRAFVHCKFDEMSHDVLHNRILKSTLARLVKTDGIAKKTRDSLTEHWRRLGGVREVPLSEQLFGQVMLHRDKYIYDFLLKVCRLLFENLLPTERPGQWRFRAFQQESKPMAALFEAFVRNFYKRELSPSFAKVTREDMRWNLSALEVGFASLLPKMQTDVSVTTSARKIIFDCKYTDDPFEEPRFEGTRKLKAQHLYQVSAYLDNLTEGPLKKNRQAILLYPMAKRSVHLDYGRPTGEMISVRTIDLSQAWPAIHADLLNLVSGPAGHIP
jgi:5-methylcytosine-specific restriction enzyme subunit McrC